MSCITGEKCTYLNLLPTFKVIPDVLSSEDLNSGHMVEPIEPLADSVQRDVLIMTAQLTHE